MKGLILKDYICCPLPRLVLALFCISKKKYPEIIMIIEKIEPIIDKPWPLKSFSMNFTKPSLNIDNVSTTDLDSPIDDEDEEITAEIEKPKITRQSSVINVAIDTIKYFCCLGTTNFLFAIFIQFILF